MLKSRKIAVIAGDGIGPEIIRQVVKIFEVLKNYSQIDLAVAHAPYSAEYYLNTKVAIPDEYIAELEKNYDAILIGPFGDPRLPDGRYAREIIWGIRNKLDLFFGYQRVKVYDSWMSPLKNTQEGLADFYIIRENLESINPKPGGSYYRDTNKEIAIQSSIYTRQNIDRFIQQAFEFAGKRNYKKVVLAHKNTLMTNLHELWLKIFQEKITAFPEINADVMNIDALLFELLSDPAKFEIIVAPGDLADSIYTAGLFLQGSYGMAHICEINPVKIGAFRIAQGSAVKIAGHNRANPLGAFIATIEMLKFLELDEAAEAVERALIQILQKHLVTIDMGGLIGTEELGNYFCEFLKEQLSISR
ncbi:MAG: putative tartrate dehydrogenase/decarboxylase TtuC' [Candidatus Marinimicrobia bacterium ADurb.Bin030]|nr:MAG: putative tartrate dehydrogenase/decarboxylase TtuC' [Candidatus Marinimicrobia bacterium ADurb.Bin030]